MIRASHFAYRLLLICSFLFFVFNLQLRAANIDSLKMSMENQQGEEKLRTMLLLGKEYQKIDRNESNIIYKDALLLIQEKDLKQKADINFKIAYNLYKLYSNDSAIVHYNIALLTYKEILDTLNMMKTYTMKGLSLQNSSYFKSATESYKLGIELFDPYWQYHEGEPNISKNHLATMMTNLGISLNNIGQYDSSLYYTTEAYKIKIEMGSSPKQIGKALVNIGNAYSSSNKNKESIEYFVDALELFIPINDSFNISKCYNNIGLAHMQIGDTLESIKYYEKSLDINRAVNDRRAIAISLINLSGLYAIKGEIQKAQTFLLEGLKAGNELGNKQLTSTANQNMAKLYYQEGNLEKALEYAKKAASIISETKEMDLDEGNKLLLSNIYEEMGNFKLSLQYHKQFKILYDSAFNTGNTERFNRLQTEFETSKKEQEIILLKKDKENQLLENKILKNRQSTYIIVIGLILILVIITGFMIYLKRKKDKQIHRQKDLYHKKEKELAQSELEKSKLKEEELQQSVIYKSKQLSTHALHMMQKNTMLQEIQSSIMEMSKKAPVDDKSNYKRVLLQIGQSLRSQKDWDVFKLYFEDVNRNFYNKLNEINPDLSKNDYRICALIKLNMSSKEMTSVLNVALNSVKSSRYRLKKKLGLDTGDKLEEFLRGL